MSLQEVSFNPKAIEQGLVENVKINWSLERSIGVIPHNSS